MQIVKKTVRHVGKRVLRPILNAQVATANALLEAHWQERFPVALDAPGSVCPSPLAKTARGQGHADAASSRLPRLGP